MSKYCLNCVNWNANGVCELLAEDAFEFDTCYSHEEDKMHVWVLFSLTSTGRLNVFDVYSTEEEAFEYRNKIPYLKDHQVAHVEELLPNE